MFVFDLKKAFIQAQYWGHISILYDIDTGVFVGCKLNLT